MAKVRKVSRVGVKSFLARGGDALLFGPFNLHNFLADSFHPGLDRRDTRLDCLDSVLPGLVRRLALLQLLYLLLEPPDRPFRRVFGGACPLRQGSVKRALPADERRLGVLGEDWLESAPVIGGHAGVVEHFIDLGQKSRNLRRGNVDLKMGGVMVAGGLAGSTLGAWLFRALREQGQIELVISICAGEPGAQYLMAWISNNGVGTATDEIAGLAYLRDAASGGYAQAKFQLAELMLDGLGVPRDETGAAQMFGEAAESGHAASQNALALLYVTGRGGVAQDLVESAEWAIKSGRQGNADAQLFISGLYRDGLGLDQDDAQAFNWAVLAANQNFGPAQLRLASYYADGLGVEADIHEAYFWWALGTLNAYGEYSPLIESLREDLIPIIPAAQRADLDRQAFNWLGIFEGAIDPDVDPLE